MEEVLKDMEELNNIIESYKKMEAETLFFVIELQARLGGIKRGYIDCNLDAIQEITDDFERKFDELRNI